MKNYILGAAVVALAAACGGGSKPTLIDAAVDALPTCNPIAQSGCKTGEKCTWLIDRDADPVTMAPAIGHVGCIAVDPAAVIDGGACMNAKAGVTGGADTCVAGDLCISSKCKPICDPQLVSGAAPGACTTNYACATYAGVFISGNIATAGVCEPTCDPLTQKLNAGTGSLEACGSPNPTMPNATCVVGRGFQSFHCAPSGPGISPTIYMKTDRVAPLADSQGRFFGNGCAPGFIPLLPQDATPTGVMTVLCTGLCAPVKTDVGTPAGNKGDPAALAKLTTEATSMAGNAVCVQGKKGSAVSSGFGEDCRFMWWLLAGGNPTNAINSPFNDTLGFCFAYEKFLDVMIPGMTQALPEKSCAELPITAPMDDPYGAAKENGCYPLSQSRRAAGEPARRIVPKIRLPYGEEPLVRHILD